MGPQFDPVYCIRDRNILQNVSIKGQILICIRRNRYPIIQVSEYFYVLNSS